MIIHNSFALQVQGSSRAGNDSHRQGQLGQVSDCFPYTLT